MEWMILPYRRYFDFEGRSRRKEYWMFLLFFVLVTVGWVAGLLAMMPFGQRFAGGAGPGVAVIVWGVVYGLFALACIIPSLALHVRRFHDQNMSGWFLLLQFVPYLGGLIVTVFMCIDGTRGPNRFGPDPKGDGGGLADVFR